MSILKCDIQNWTQSSRCDVSSCDHNVDDDKNHKYYLLYASYEPHMEVTELSYLKLTISS